MLIVANSFAMSVRALCCVAVCMYNRSSVANTRTVRASYALLSSIECHHVQDGPQICPMQ